MVIMKCKILEDTKKDEKNDIFPSCYLLFLQKYINIQWNPSCDTNYFTTEMWPFKRSDLTSGT